MSYLIDIVVGKIYIGYLMNYIWIDRFRGLLLVFLCHVCVMYSVACVNKVARTTTGRSVQMFVMAELN